MIEATQIIAEIARYIALAQAGGEIIGDGKIIVEGISKLFGGTPSAATDERLAELKAERISLAAQIDEDIPPEQD